MPASAFGDHLQPFSGITSFMRCPATRELAGADVVIVGVPYDSATSYRSGARFGPRKIREASAMIWGYHNSYRLKPLEVLRVVDYGDVEVVPPSIADTYRNTEAEVTAILETGATVLALGGDHSISLPLLRAHARRFGPLAVIHFDSHPDTWDSEYPGQPYSHGTIYRRALEEGLIRPEAYIQIGLRGSTGAAGDWDWARERGARVIVMDEATTLGIPALSAAMHATASGPVYVTFDIDVADPAFAPGTGTPEVGGFTSQQLLHLVRGLKGLNLVGFDLVEVNPLYDPGDITALLAANVAFEFVALLAAQRGQKAV